MGLRVQRAGAQRPQWISAGLLLALGALCATVAAQTVERAPVDVNEDVKSMAFTPLTLQLNGLPQALGLKSVAPIDRDATFGLAAGSEVPVMDLSSAMGLAVQTNPDVAIVQAVARGADARVAAAQAQLFARLSLTKSNGRGAYTSPANDFTTDQRGELSLEMRQPMFHPAGWNELRRQEVLRVASDLDLRAKQGSVALDSGLTFLSVLLTQGKLDLSLEYESRLRELLKYIQERAAGGLSSITESNRVASRLEGTLADLSEARANLRVAVSSLVRLVGQRPAAVNFVNSLAPPPPGMTAAQIVELVEDNPDLIAARKQLEAMRLAVKAASAGYLPRLDLVVSGQRNENVGATPGVVTESKSMLVLTYTLFNGGADYAAVAEAIAKVDEQTARCDLIARQLRSDVETTLAGLDSLDARYRATERQIKLDAQVVDNFNAQLNSGNRQLLDVLDAHQRLYQSRLQLLQLGVTQAQAYLRLSYQTGRLAQGLLDVR